MSSFWPFTQARTKSSEIDKDSFYTSKWNKSNPLTSNTRAQYWPEWNRFWCRSMRDSTELLGWCGGGRSPLRHVALSFSLVPNEEVFDLTPSLSKRRWQQQQPTCPFTPGSRLFHMLHVYNITTLCQLWIHIKHNLGGSHRVLMSANQWPTHDSHFKCLTLTTSGGLFLAHQSAVFITL